METLAEKLARFSQLDNITGCIVWQRCLEHGYGGMAWKGKHDRAHRWSWLAHKGPIPTGLWVLHDCPAGDNRACINPDHLWLGTHEDNQRDKINKGRGRGPRGSQSHSCRLTEDQVREIRRSTLRLRELATLYGITMGAASHIRTRRNWAYLPD